LKRSFPIGLAVVALLISPLPPRLAHAQMGHHGGMMGPEGMMGPLPVFLRAANLTPAQQTQVKQILQSNRASLHKQFEQIRSAREQIANKLFSTGVVAAGDLTAQSQQIVQAEQQLLQGEINVALQLRALLTPAQLQKVSQVHQQFESLHQQMRALLEPLQSDGNTLPPDDAPPPPA
jgi:Spy/CpxP family protein refolding chaperone